jgi:signal transduction histidine kinase/DNA-binding response OmpR family regulator
MPDGYAMVGDDDDLLFGDDDDGESGIVPAKDQFPVDYLDPWVILVVDDDEQIHTMTKLLLKKFLFQGRGAELLMAYSAASATEILLSRPDIAVILLDVVMESEDAGLRLVPVIRNEMGNKRVRIVLRTGQPGQAPERDVILNYDINDYKSKTELTAQKLFTTMVASLRSYQDIVAIERNRIGLEKILNASSSLFDKRSMHEFVEGAIIQLEALLRGKEGSVLCCQAKDSGASSDDDIIILAATRSFAAHIGQPLRQCLPTEICSDIEQAFHTQTNIFAPDRCILVFRTHDHGANVFFLRRPEPFTADERTLLEVFCSKVAIGFDNVCLYEDLNALNNTLEQQVAERSLEAKEKSRLLEATLASMSDGLAAFDESGNLVVHNRRALELLGLPENFHQPSTRYEDLEARLGVMARVRPATPASEGAPEEIEFSDGRIVQLRRTLMAGGGHVYVCLDITEERQRQRELITARSQAEAANRAKSQFLATMSHEIRTPMTGVQGMLDLLQHTQLDEEQQELVSVVRESASSLLTIINDILDFSKIEAGKMLLEHAPVSIAALIESTVEILATSAFKKGLSLISVVDPAIPDWLSGDAVRLRQILFNLVGNAVKFTEAGSVVVRAEMIERLDGRVRLRLSVADSGIGISPESKIKLFRPFSQADETTTRRFGGTGLGLSICRHLVDLMDGTIDVDSVADQGSTFHVILTLDDGTPCSPTPALPRLDGVVVALDLPEGPEHQAAGLYLTAAGATLAAAGATAALTVIDGEKATAPTGHPTVVIARRDPAGLSADGSITTVLRPMRRAALLRAAVSALGRPEPLAAPTPRPIMPAPCPAAGPDKRLILVAEDNPVNRMVIKRLLALLGRNAEIVEDGQQALNAWRSGRYAMVLTDCHMPEMDGFALSRAIRAEESDGRSRTPIIAFTAAATSDEVKLCTDAGMDDFLPKPVDLDRLKAALSRWLDR